MCRQSTYFLAVANGGFGFVMRHHDAPGRFLQVESQRRTASYQYHASTSSSSCESMVASRDVADEDYTESYVNFVAQ